MSLQRSLVRYGAMLEHSKEYSKLASIQASVSSQWTAVPSTHTEHLHTQAADPMCFGLLRHRQIKFDEGPQNIAYIFMTQA